jgi:galactokinase
MSVDENVITERLAGSGMGRAEAVRKGRWFTQTLAALEGCGDFSAGGSAAGDPYLLFVPGRIEVLGKHTDYAGGRSLLAAVERGFSIAARPRGDCRLRITDAASGEVADFALEADLVPAAGHWSNYPMTVARRVARNFPGPLRGADAAFKSDLPPAAGMSSSSALITGMFKVLSQVNRLTEREEYRANITSDEALAAYLATIENGRSFASLAGDRGVGTFGGSEDHTAICCCRPGTLHEYAFCPVRFQQAIPLPAGYVFALGASGVLAEKTGEAMAKYNRASRLVGALLELWQADTGRRDRCLADAVHGAHDAADRLRRVATGRPHADFAAAALLGRLEQFLDENERIIPAAARALAQGAMDAFGDLVDQSQHGAEEFLENQVPQTIGLARSARQCGAVAASAFGAGFGGSVWALVEAASAADFLAAWADRYRREFPAEAQRSHFFLSGAGPGLVEIAEKTTEMKM